MEDVDTFFFDSYALIEVYKGSENYDKYKSVKIITSYFHVYEVYNRLIQEFGEEEFRDFFQFLQSFCVNLKFEWIPEAVRLRRFYNKRALSYADCIGYVIAKDLGVKFLTGDKEFEDLENVEWVKWGSEGVVLRFYLSLSHGQIPRPWIIPKEDPITPLK